MRVPIMNCFHPPICPITGAPPWPAECVRVGPGPRPIPRLPRFSPDTRPEAEFTFSSPALSGPAATVRHQPSGLGWSPAPEPKAPESAPGGRPASRPGKRGQGTAGSPRQGLTTAGRSGISGLSVLSGPSQATSAPFFTLRELAGRRRDIPRQACRKAAPALRGRRSRAPAATSGHPRPTRRAGRFPAVRFAAGALRAVAGHPVRGILATPSYHRRYGGEEAPDPRRWVSVSFLTGIDKGAERG
jgi:hypothetical protein